MGYLSLMVVVHPVCVELCVSDVEGSLLTGMTGMCVCVVQACHTCVRRAYMRACVCVC